MIAESPLHIYSSTLGPGDVTTEARQPLCGLGQCCPGGPITLTCRRSDLSNSIQFSVCIGRILNRASRRCCQKGPRNGKWCSVRDTEFQTSYPGRRARPSAVARRKGLGDPRDAPPRRQQLATPGWHLL